MCDLNGVVQKLFRAFGYQLRKYPADLHLRRRIDLLKQYGITTVFDVGANSGQFAAEIRKLGFNGMIHSFEPQGEVFKKLSENSQADKSWRVYNYALGDCDCTSEINLSENTYSSSLLEIMPEHLDSAPQSKYVGKEKISVKRLDSVFPDLVSESEKVFLKIDTQGFEKKVLAGASKSLKEIIGIQLEMSLVPLYKGDTSFEEMNSYLNSLSYHLCSIEMEFDNPVTHKILQINGIYYKC